MKCSFPGSVTPPILLSLSVEMDYMFASRWLIDQLNKFGFVESYGEFNRFKQGVVVNEDVTNLIQSSLGPDGFLTFADDKVDHNIKTLGGCYINNNHNVVRSPGDADTVIVSNILDFACLGHEIKQIGADTDLVIMLIYMWNEMMGKITMKSETTGKQNEVRRDIEQYSSCLGDIRKYITYSRFCTV